MRSFFVFFVRLILSVFLAFIIGRIFFENISLAKLTGLAVIMLTLAYLFEYTRKRDRGGDDGS